MTGKTYILYNPLAGNIKERTSRYQWLKNHLKDQDAISIEVTEIDSYKDFLSGLSSEDAVYLCGGDGTINRLINGMGNMELPCSFYYMSAGTGNDFLNDLGKDPEGSPFCINEYVKNLPQATVNGKQYYFINNVGFGIDGYCSEMGDRQKKTSEKPVNYTKIAIKGLLFGYKPKNAVVTVDGVKYTYKKVWLAPTMKGRFYGGGMMAAPGQNRLDEDGKVSLMLIHDIGKLHTLVLFPSIFKGEHIKYKKNVAIHTGYNITVEFDEPASVQVDGETIKNVTKYQVNA